VVVDELMPVVLVDELELVEDEVVEMLVVVVDVTVLVLVWLEVELSVWATIGVGEKAKTDPKTRMIVTSSSIPRCLFDNFHWSHHNVSSSAFANSDKYKRKLHDVVTCLRPHCPFVTRQGQSAKRTSPLASISPLSLFRGRKPNSLLRTTPI